MEQWLENFAEAAFRRSGDTAHDLKTPLNVAVLNLELLRMRLRKISGVADDEKIANCLQAIEAELRRMGRIFDVYFLLSAPPKNEGEPAVVQLVAIAAESAASLGWPVSEEGPLPVLGHEPRIRQAVKLLFEGTSKFLRSTGCRVTAGREGDKAAITITGEPEQSDYDLAKLFKLYHSDWNGQPDLSLATARLIAETYGGELNATEDRDKVIRFRLTLPLGER